MSKRTLSKRHCPGRRKRVYSVVMAKIIIMMLVAWASQGIPRASAADSEKGSDAEVLPVSQPSSEAMVSLEAARKSGRHERGRALISWEKIPLMAPPGIPMLGPAEPVFTGARQRQFEMEEVSPNEPSSDSSG